VTSRVKERKSLASKIDRIPGKYSQLADITDVVGLRVITYFEDTVDDVAKIIEREFEVDQGSSDDKRQVSDPERFGYASLHYVVGVSAERVRLKEYKRFSGMKAEIQVRSVLQHAWAEIEHDLGYKIREAIPRDYIRGFARLASLLELADVEFVRLRDGLARYDEEVGQLIDEHPQSVPLDQSSLQSYIRQSDMVKELDARVAHLLNAAEADYSSLHVDHLLRGAHRLGINTVGELDGVVAKFGEQGVALAGEYIRIRSRRPLDMPAPRGRAGGGIALAYLIFYLAAREGDHDKLAAFLEYILPEGSGRSPQLEEWLMAAYNSLK